MTVNGILFHLGATIKLSSLPCCFLYLYLLGASCKTVVSLNATAKLSFLLVGKT